MYLGIRTDSPRAELYLYKSLEQIGYEAWQADRQLANELLGKTESFLDQHGLVFSDLTGLFAYRGPGSFTGLRIGLTVFNTMAYARQVPVVGADGEKWLEDAIGRLASGEDDEIVLPLYGADARITKPKK